MASSAQEQQRAEISVAGIGTPTAARGRLLAGTTGLCAVVWFLFLSGWFGVEPGSALTMRQNVLFNSDSSLWIERMIGNARSPEQLVHPLEILLWRGPCRALYYLLEGFLPSDHAAVLAPRLLVAAVAGIGVGFLALLALRNGVRITQFVLLFVMYLLFTSSSTVSLPEHFAISSGLLSVAFVVPVLLSNARIRTAALAGLTVLCGGTTVTNALFPLGSLAHFSFKSARAKIVALAIAIPVGLGVGVFLFTRSYTIHWFVTQYLNLASLHDLRRAGTYTFFAIVSPVIGPAPRVLRVPGWDMLSYEPAGQSLRLSYYSWAQVVGIVAWISLLSMCIFRGLREEKTRLYVWLPLGWIVFNAAFHNIWGAELFLFAPHWTWALMGLVILGARDLSRGWVAAFVVPIVATQIYSLVSIKSALDTVVR